MLGILGNSDRNSDPTVVFKIIGPVGFLFFISPDRTKNFEKYCTGPDFLFLKKISRRRTGPRKIRTGTDYPVYRNPDFGPDQRKSGPKNPDRSGKP